MNKNLNLRLRKVAAKLDLLTRLRKVALTEDEMIDRMAPRSKKMLLDIRRKFADGLRGLSAHMRPPGGRAITYLSLELAKVVEETGTVNVSALEDARRASEELWKRLTSNSTSEEGSVTVSLFYAAFGHFLKLAMIGSRLQDSRMLEQAKADPRYKDRLYKALEQFAESLSPVQVALQKAQSSLPAVKEQPEAEPEQDTIGIDAAKNQLNDVNVEVGKTANILKISLVYKAKENVQTSSSKVSRDLARNLATAINDNFKVIFDGQTVHKKLVEEDNGFLEKALNLELGTNSFDLNKLKTNSNKKLYSAYRVVVKVISRLGVIQYIMRNPKRLLENSSLQHIVVGIQEKVKLSYQEIKKYLNTPIEREEPEQEQEPKVESKAPAGAFGRDLKSEEEPGVAPKNTPSKAPAGTFREEPKKKKKEPEKKEPEEAYEEVDDAEIEEVNEEPSGAPKEEPTAEAPTATPKEEDPKEEDSEEEPSPMAINAVKEQLTSAEEDVRGTVTQLARVILRKAEEVLGPIGLTSAIEDNIDAIFKSDKVNPKLNKEREYNQQAIHLELGGDSINLSELDTEAKKAVYLSYRSLVMVIRALGVLQIASKHPKQVAKNKEMQALVVKAQEITKSRTATIVSYLKLLRKPEKDSKPDKERGIPAKSFSDFFKKKK